MEMSRNGVQLSKEKIAQYQQQEEEETLKEVVIYLKGYKLL